ncbi:Cytochrome b-c1 complex subunit 7 [Coemansia sp. BCRC 34490]|nr:Cytochrome b-c1 complex subunit 7 [Coemansia sp. Benny D160-2]KAJ2517804.1 Cytochrome b-c1 complex subunit 7 [Coemansia sp. RSA 1939]KAJ2524704.1 Cytochrome b-c1 complex subunit 7 [Coemansia sp. RSA 2049]KAJ2601032.1 Cytochrome b-c1 complex subunit 7 [Coemansia sp. RSA 1804]KAJ2694149.1 Cytochrome b-c1 complex subunit 7 [Coemansia sp. RSA 1285]KAJ2730531.1 Cytochrome b-c1 complex subunit 7 [Coemansia sp. BCRC 34490]
MESVARVLQNNTAFRAIVRPLANTWVNLSGYRRLGLRYDDLLREETPIIQEAISRLSRDEIDARNFRHRRAFQLSLSHQELPSPQWTKPQDDYKYLQPLIEDVRLEQAERDAFNSMTYVQK